MIFRRRPAESQDRQRGGEQEVEWLRDQLQESSNKLAQARLELSALQRSVSTEVGEHAQTSRPSDTNAEVVVVETPEKGKDGSFKRSASRLRRQAAPPKFAQPPHLLVTAEGLVADDEPPREGDLARPDEATSTRIIATISKRAPFEGNEEAALAKVVAAMVPCVFETGSNVLKQGEEGDLAYWVSSGRLAVLVDGKQVIAS